MSEVTGERFSRLSGGARIGASYFERQGARVSGAPCGLVDALTDLATPDVARAIDPRVAAFFVDTASLELHVRPRWSPLFLPGAILFRLVATLLGQLRLPLRPARVLTRLLALDRVRDGRDGARGVLRVYDDGSPMQVVAYAVSPASPVEGGAPPAHMSVAFPVPFGVLQGFLALSLLDGGGAELASSPSRGGGGVWLSLGRRSFRSPFAEVMRLWPAGSPAAPRDLDEAQDDGATIVGTHEQTLFGVRFVRYRYRFRPIAAATARPHDP